MPSKDLSSLRNISKITNQKTLRQGEKKTNLLCTGQLIFGQDTTKERGTRWRSGTQPIKPMLDVVNDLLNATSHDRMTCARIDQAVLTIKSAAMRRRHSFSIISEKTKSRIRRNRPQIRRDNFERNIRIPTSIVV